MSEQKPKAPSTKELADLIHKLLEHIDRCESFDDVPQVAALRAMLASYPSSAARDLVYTLWTAFEEQWHGPMPRFKELRHPNHAYWEDLLHDLDELVIPHGPQDSGVAEAKYQPLRQALLAERGFAARLPSLRAARTLAALQMLLEDAAEGADKADRAKEEFWADELRPLREWLNGRCISGSPEWVAQEAWFVRCALNEVGLAMTRIAQLREAVEGTGVTEVRESRWRRFVRTEFQGSGLVRALEVAGASCQAERDAVMLDRTDPKVRMDNDAWFGRGLERAVKNQTKIGPSSTD